LAPQNERYNEVAVYYYFIPIVHQGKTSGGSKITERNTNCLEVRSTLASRHQQNHHAAKPN